MTKEQSKKFKAKVIQMLQAGENKRKIAEILNVKYTTLSSYCLRNGIVRQKRIFSNYELDILKNNPTSTAAKILHRSFNTIEKYRYETGIYYERYHNDLYENIVADFYSKQFNQSEIARKYNVSRQYVSAIIKRLDK